MARLRASVARRDGNAAANPFSESYVLFLATVLRLSRLPAARETASLLPFSDFRVAVQLGVHHSLHHLRVERWPPAVASRSVWRRHKGHVRCPPLQDRAVFDDVSPHGSATRKMALRRTARPCADTARDDVMPARSRARIRVIASSSLRPRPACGGQEPTVRLLGYPLSSAAARRFARHGNRAGAMRGCREAGAKKLRSRPVLPHGRCRPLREP